MCELCLHRSLILSRGISPALSHTVFSRMSAMSPWLPFLRPRITLQYPETTQVRIQYPETTQVWIQYPETTQGWIQYPETIASTDLWHLSLRNGKTNDAGSQMTRKRQFVFSTPKIHTFSQIKLLWVFHPIKSAIPNLVPR